MSENIDKGMKAILSRMLTTLEQKVAPSHTALIVMDVQNDFCARGGAFDREGKDMDFLGGIVPRLINLITEARKAGVNIVYSRSVHSSEGSNYLSDAYVEQQMRHAKGRYIEYPMCKEGSWGADFYDGIEPLPQEPVVTKHRFSTFMDTNLDLILRSRGIRSLIMTGMATNVCVETTARDGFMKDYYIVFLRDCTSATSKELHNNTLKNIDLYFGEVVDAGDVVRCWQRSA
jgi:ureidoacrylate peracid hydrolase